MKDIIDHILIYHDVLSALRSYDDTLVQLWDEASVYTRSTHSDFQEYREVSLRSFVQSFLINNEIKNEMC